MGEDVKELTSGGRNAYIQDDTLPGGPRERVSSTSPLSTAATGKQTTPPPGSSFDEAGA